MGKIVAIGGGELKNLETLPIDKEIIKLTGKKHPNALLIPTASNDSEERWKTFQKIYGRKLGCKTNVLYLIKEQLTQNQIREKILSSDLIYVSGGDTAEMLKVWRKLGVDKILKIAYNKGVVLSGISAGSYCWFRRRVSSSKCEISKCLGFIPLNNVCHYPKRTTKERNKRRILRMIEKTPGITIALENWSAIIFINDKYKIIVSKENAKAYKLYTKNKQLIKKQIAQTRGFRPLAELLVKD